MLLDEVKELIYWILKYYLNREDYDLNSKKYYIYDPWNEKKKDDENRMFDILSKYKRIGLLTSLDPKEVQVIFYLFRMLHDNHNDEFMKNDCIEIEWKDNIDISSLFSVKNMMQWIALFEKISEMNNYDRDGNWTENVTPISLREFTYSEMYISDIIPKPIMNKQYPLSDAKYKQKFYGIQELIMEYYGNRLLLNEEIKNE